MRTRGFTRKDPSIFSPGKRAANVCERLPRRIEEFSVESKFWYYIDPASSGELEGSMKNTKLYRLLFYRDVANGCSLAFPPCYRSSKMLKKLNETFVQDLYLMIGYFKIFH